jgi:hypothetical protein
VLLDYGEMHKTVFLELFFNQKFIKCDPFKRQIVYVKKFNHDKKFKYLIIKYDPKRETKVLYCIKASSKQRFVYIARKRKIVYTIINYTKIYPYMYIYLYTLFKTPHLNLNTPPMIRE